MGDRRDTTPGWFWPIFATGTGLLALAIGSSAIAGVWVLGVWIANAAETGSSSCSGGSCGYQPPAYVPPAYVAPAGGIAPVPDEPYVGTLSVELVTDEARSARGIARGDRCTLALSFEGDASGDGRCTGSLACGERELWSADGAQAFECRSAPGTGTIVAVDRPDDGRARISATIHEGEATVVVTGRRGLYVVARSE